MDQKEVKLKHKTIVNLLELKHMLENGDEYQRRFLQPTIRHDLDNRNIIRLSFNN